MSLFETVCKTNIDLANRLKSVATDYKTLYVMGCFGAPLTQKNKDRYCTNHSYNKDAKRTAMIRSASEDTFGFDCVCLIKGILWGWKGDVTRTYGGASYITNGVPDINADQMILECKDVSTDFSKIEVGEAVWMKGHIGVYIGNGLAVESTPAWKNKVQITACNQTINGYNRRNWKKHGKLPYIEYLAETTDDTADVEFEELDVVKIRPGVTTYSNGNQMASWVPSSKLYVREVYPTTVVISTSQTGAVTGVVFKKDLILVEKAQKVETVIPPVVTLEGKPSTGSTSDEKVMWDFLLEKLNNEYGVAGLMGNLFAESLLVSNNLEQRYEKSLGYTDSTYTAAVDNKSYTNFVKDSAGYGLAQWTFWSRKENLLKFAASKNKSIGDFQMQLEFLWDELSSDFITLTNMLKKCTSVREASDAVLHRFEQPADQSEAVEIKRAEYGSNYYEKYKKVEVRPVEPEKPQPEPAPEVPVEPEIVEPEIVEPEIISPEDKTKLLKLIESVIDFIISLFKKSK